MIKAKQLKIAFLVTALACTAWAAGRNQKFTESELRYWAYQTVRKPPVPAVKNRAWVKNAVDAFILKELESKQIAPAPRADKITLIRRLRISATFYSTLTSSCT